MTMYGKFSYRIIGNNLSQQKLPYEQSVPAKESIHF